MGSILRNNAIIKNLVIGGTGGSGGEGGGGGYSVPIESTGLKLWWDAGDVNSYSGTGTAITDLSGTGFNGELIGSPTFVSDGESSYFSISNPNSNRSQYEYLILENYIRGIGGSGTNPFDITFPNGYTTSIWMQINTISEFVILNDAHQETFGFGSSDPGFRNYQAAKYGRRQPQSASRPANQLKYAVQGYEITLLLLLQLGKILQ